MHKLTIWTLRVLALLIAIAAGVYFWTIGLDSADKVSGVAAAIISAAALVSVYLWPPQPRGLSSVGNKSNIDTEAPASVSPQIGRSSLNERFTKWVGPAILAVPALSAVITILYLSLRNALVITLMTVAVSIFSLNQVRLSVRLLRTLLAFIATLLATLSLSVAVWPTPTVTASTPPSGLQIDIPSNVAVGKCVVYSGPGKIEAGYTLLIFDRAIDQRGGYLNQDYTFAGTGSSIPAIPNRWSTSQIIHGSENVEVVVAEVANETLEYIDTIYAPGSKENLRNGLRAYKLPPARRIQSIRVRVDIANDGACQ